MKQLTSFFFELSSISRKIANRLSSKDEWRNILRRWKSDNIESDLRLNYPELKKESIVFDLGGYEGQWASDIFSKYQCNVFIFEPMPAYVLNIENRFERNNHIKVYAFGLAEEDKVLPISIEENSSSLYKKGGQQIEIELKEAKRFLVDNDFNQIDLMKINIEGGEYDLLEHLINEGFHNSIKNLQVQFHNFVPDALTRMNQIQEKLSKTHRITYQYKFLWENWELIEQSEK